jgi:hypothetical protein
MTENITPRQVEAAKLLEGALRGDRNDRIKLQEGIATSDLPVQLAPVINKILFENYQTLPKIWDQFATRIVVDDFRKQEYLNLRYEDEGMDNQGDKFRDGSLPTVGENDEYPTAGFFSVTESDFAVKKAGQRVRFSWEAVVNDNNISILERLPIELAQKAAGKEDEEVTKQLVASSGLNTANFKSANNNLFAGNGALTLENLEKAVEAANLQQYNGKLIQPVTRFALVIPRALEMTARRIFSVQEIRTQNGSGSGSTVTITGNPLNASTFEIVVNDWLTKINSGAGAYWFLIPVPSVTLNPSVVLGFLRGYEAPELRVKAASGQFLGGGAVPENYGSFDNDDWQMRIRHIATGGFFIPAGTLASTGAGS